MDVKLAHDLIHPDGNCGGSACGQSETSLQESEEQLRALQNEFAHLARVIELGEMAVAVAHEINQPLTAITNYLNAGRMAARESTAEALARARRSMALAVEQGLRAGAIIRGLRAFAKKGNGARRVTAADSLVDAAMTLALIDVSAAGVLVEHDPAGGGALLEVDPVQIQQVLVNLLRNAVEALAENPPDRPRCLRIDVSEDRAAAMVRFRIADSGPGIDPNIKDRLFEPFVTSKEKGMGMGLSVCRRIVEAHGGTIEVADWDAGGTVFTVGLPRFR